MNPNFSENQKEALSNIGEALQTLLFQIQVWKEKYEKDYSKISDGSLVEDFKIVERVADKIEKSLLRLEDSV